jgi:hypothetical protein
LPLPMGRDCSQLYAALGVDRPDGSRTLAA